MSADQLKLVELGAMGLSHVRARLEAGKSLSRYVLENVSLNSGAVFTALPVATSIDEIPNLVHGGVIDGETSRSSQIERICEHLSSSPAAVAYFEDLVARPSDPVMGRCPTKMLTLGEELFHVLDYSDANAHAAEVTLSWQASASGEVIVLSSFPQAIAPSFPFETTSDHLATIAANTTSILVDVFDGEGFAIWMRTG